MDEATELLRELDEWADTTANGIMWRYKDQPVAKKVRAFLEASQ